MKIGLYFGSFNPIHIGHLAVANYMVEYSDLEQIWFVVSPQNPLKNKKSLLADYSRYELVVRAIGDSQKYRASNIEFGLPKPSYTIDTLVHLEEKYPKHEFVLITGADNLQTLHKWKNYEILLNKNNIYVYPRPNYDGGELKNHKNINIIENAPQMEISSSFIRQAIKEGKDVEFFMPKAAYKYLDGMNFYKK